jgi:hypothetical protein
VSAHIEDVKAVRSHSTFSSELLLIAFVITLTNQIMQATLFGGAAGRASTTPGMAFFAIPQ